MIGVDKMHKEELKFVKDLLIDKEVLEMYQKIRLLEKNPAPPYKLFGVTCDFAKAIDERKKYFITLKKDLFLNSIIYRFNSLLNGKSYDLEEIFKILNNEIKLDNFAFDSVLTGLERNVDSLNVGKKTVDLSDYYLLYSALNSKQQQLIDYYDIKLAHHGLKDELMISDLSQFDFNKTLEDKTKVRKIIYSKEKNR